MISHTANVLRARMWCIQLSSDWLRLVLLPTEFTVLFWLINVHIFDFQDYLLQYHLIELFYCLTYGVIFLCFISRDLSNNALSSSLESGVFTGLHKLFLL